MLLYGFESRLGLENSGFSMCPFLKLVARGFLRVLRFPPLLHRLMVQPIKSSSNKCDFNSVKPNSWAVPSYHVARNTTCCTWYALDVLHVICTRLRQRHVSALFGDGLRRSEEIVKKKKNLELRLWMWLLLLLFIFQVDSYQWLNIGFLVATLLGAWPDRVSARTAWPGVNIAWLGETAYLSSNFFLCVAAHKTEQIRPWNTQACCWDVKRPGSTTTTNSNTRC